MFRVAMKDDHHDGLMAEGLPAGKAEGLQTDSARADFELVKLVQQGNKRSFDLLVTKYQSRVIAIVGRFVKDPSEAQDIAQEAFIKAYRAIKSFRGDSAFYTWLYRIAVNTAKNFLVAKKRRPGGSGVDIALDDDEQYLDGLDVLQEVETPESKLMRDELKRVIDAAISSLSEELRTAICLREFDGLSYEEIAAALDCPVGTVRSRIFRAREVIDEKIKLFMQ
jgi:RNA polymerase sigma-70 factor (ECF subfamily)